YRVLLIYLFIFIYPAVGMISKPDILLFPKSLLDLLPAFIGIDYSSVIGNNHKKRSRHHVFLRRGSLDYHIGSIGKFRRRQGSLFIRKHLSHPVLIEFAARDRLQPAMISFRPGLQCSFIYGGRPVLRKIIIIKLL